MIKIENVEVMGWEAAVRGMRNPMNSWAKSDSHRCDILKELTNKNYSYRCAGCKNESTGRPNCTVIGANDYDLMTRLRNAGTDHRKFMRMITVYLDITAPLYWWKEFDTYRVGVEKNSCSTMHKIAAKEFTLEDFSTEHLMPSSLEHFEETIGLLNDARNAYIHYDDSTYGADDQFWIDLRNNWTKKDCWWQLIQLLPSSYNQRRTIMLNYEVLANIYKSRKDHRLDEWRDFCKWIETLPYSELITGDISEKEKEQ